LLTGLIARELGGRAFAQGVGALCVLLAPGLLALDHFLSMNTFEPLFWMGCAYLIIRMVRTDNTRLWLWFGVLAGVGLENKYSMAIFGFGIVVGLLLTEQRWLLRTKWLWIGGAIAFLAKREISGRSVSADTAGIRESLEAIQHQTDAIYGAQLPIMEMISEAIQTTRRMEQQQAVATPLLDKLVQFIGRPQRLDAERSLEKCLGNVYALLTAEAKAAAIEAELRFLQRDCVDPSVIPMQFAKAFECQFGGTGDNHQRSAQSLLSTECSRKGVCSCSRKRPVRGLQTTGAFFSSRRHTVFGASPHSPFFRRGSR
jgi:hypothetical protein